jgi:hypothetical protein
VRIRDALRWLLVAVGVLLVVGAAWSLATLPPPPPSGRDIPGGFAVIFLGLGVLAGVFLAVLGLTLTGDDDPVFSGAQRTVLRVIGYLLGGSVLVGVVVLFTVDVLLGVVVPGLVALLVLPVVLGVVLWRAGEALASVV